MKDYSENQKAATEGTTPDEMNPIFLLSGVRNDMLVEIAKGNIDVQDLAKYALAGRGYSNEGTWIGFKAAENNQRKFWNASAQTWMTVPE